MISPLCNTGILHSIFGYVGPRDWLFVAAVSSLWRDWYLKAAASTAKSTGTCYAAVFASASRVQLAFENGLHLKRIDNTTLQYRAGKHGSASALIHAELLGLPVSDVVFEGAAESGCLAKVDSLHLHTQRRQLPERISSHAAKSGSIELISWLIEQGCTLDSDTCYWAAASGHLPLLQFLYKHDCSGLSRTCDAAALRGDLAMLQWLRNQGCPWAPAEIAESAAASGSIALMTWLRSQSEITFSESTMQRAAARGQLSMCQFLHAAGCPWDSRACCQAARQQQLHVLRWLCEHECPCDAASVCTAAAKSGSLDTMAYLQQQQLMESSSVLTAMLNAAGAYDQLAAAKWLLRQGAEWPDTCAEWSRGMIRWATQQGCLSLFTF
jgi:hypothetical protein